MSRIDSSRAVAIFVAALVLCSALPVHADVRTEARRHFTRGMHLIEQRRTDEGVAELEAAYEILPHPDVLYNAARAYLRVGRYDDAIRYFERYLESDPPDRDAIDETVRRLEIERDAERAHEPRSGAVPSTSDEGATSGESSSAPATSGTEAASTRGMPDASGESGTASTSPATVTQVDALRELASQLDAMAEALDSNGLRTRAARLRGLAEALATAPPPSSPSVPTASSDRGSDVSTASVESSEAAMPTLAEAPTTVYEERVVSASRHSESPLDAPSSTAVITRQDIRLSGITQIGELLRRVAGVQVMSTGPADVNVGIRGFNQLLSPRVLVLINGRSTYVDPLGITLWSQMPIAIEDIERIEVIRGPASALYGANGFSGVVNILTRRPGDEPGVEAAVGVGNAGQARVSLGASGRSLGGLTYRLSASYQQANRYTLPFDPARLDLSYPVDHPEKALETIQARGHLEYRFGRAVRLDVEGGLNQAQQLAIQGTGTRSDYYLRGPYAYAMAQLQSEWGGLRSFWNHYDVDAQQPGNASLGNSATWNTIDVEGTFARSFRTGTVAHSFVAGASYRRKTIEWNVLPHDYDENHYALFLQESADVGEHLRVVAGVRMDRHPLLDRPVFSPRGAVVVKPTEGHAIRISAGSAFRTQNFLESYILDTLPTPVSAVGAVGIGSVLRSQYFGTPPLEPERIFAAELGYHYAGSDVFELELSAYYDRVKDLVRTATATTRFTVFDYAQGSDVAAFQTDLNRFTVGFGGYRNDPAVYDVFGGELSARLFPIDGLDVYANVSWNLGYAELEGERARVRSTPLVQLNAGVQYRASFGLDVALDVHAVAATQWIEQVTTTAGLVGETFDLPAYCLVNSRLGYRLFGDRLELGVVVTNLTNQHFRQHPFSQPLASRVMGTAAYRF